MMIRSTRELAEFAKDYRKRKKLSQGEIGDRVGLRQKTVSEFENGPEGAKLETFFKLLSALELEMQLVPKGESSQSATGWNREW